MIRDLIDSALVLEDLSATDKDAALDEILDHAVSEGVVAKRKRAAVRKLLGDREALGSTGIGNGVAVPHVKSADMDRICLVLARSTQGIPYDAVDGRDVTTVFMLLAPTDAADQHLQSLRWISSLARNQDFRRFVMSAADQAAVRDLLHEMSPEA